MKNAFHIIQIKKPFEVRSSRSLSFSSLHMYFMPIDPVFFEEARAVGFSARP